MTENITINDISHFLINNNYQLTALEFDFELIERGIESKYLRNYFTNPENFENVTSHVEVPMNRIKASPSISTIDSIDFAKYSDDGYQQSDERIKVLEFELRKKNDEVRKLREELTLMSTSKMNKAFVFDGFLDSENADSELDTSGPLMAHENRALNFLINEYLLQHGFKLTAVSFSEEITNQDLDIWDDVGLNIPKLPNLECFIRAKRPVVEEDSFKVVPKTSIVSEMEIQTDPMDRELIEHYIHTNERLETIVESMNKEVELLNVKYEKTAEQLKESVQLNSLMKKELNDARSKLICAQRDLMFESAKKKVAFTGNLSTSGEMDFKSETVSIMSDAINEAGNNSDSFSNKDHPAASSDDNFVKVESENMNMVTNMFEEVTTRRNTTLAFTKYLQLIHEDDKDDQQNLVTLVDSLDQFVSVVTDVLPNLFVAANNKNNSDLTMLLVQCACLHPDSKTREKLLRFLINIHPDPSPIERVMVMKQIQILSGYLGAFRVEAELITQIWEMLYEKPKHNSNTRILLANICGVVCPLAPSNLRSSLILSIHQQMLEEESDPKVVPHIIASIASTIPHLDDVDKIPLIILIIAKYLWKSDSSKDKKMSSDNEMTAEEVVKRKLLPAIAQWCIDADILHTTLIHEVLMSMKQLTMSSNHIEYFTICLHLNVIQLLIPFVEVWIKLSTPQILDDIDDGSKSNSIVHFDESKIMELYRIEFIVDRAKYKQIHLSFLHYTGINLPKSMLNDPGESTVDMDSTIQCWTAWSELRWLQTELISTLESMLDTVRPRLNRLDLSDPHVMSDLAKNQFTTTPLKSKEMCIRICTILYDLGCRLSFNVVNNLIIPCFASHIFESSDKGVNCNIKSDSISSGIVAGYCSLMAALVQLDNSHLATENLKRFLTNISFLVAAENLPYDGVKLAIDALCSGFGDINALSDIILNSMQPCVECQNVPVRLFVCLMLQELVIQLSDFPNVEDRIFVNVMFYLKKLIDCPYEVVKVMSVGPLVSLAQAKSITSSTRAQAFMCLSDLMSESVNFKSEPLDRGGNNPPCTEVLITALIQMINVVGPTSPESFKDEAILPWLLGISEINNGTSDSARRSGIAMILYSTFSTLSYYLESSNSLETCVLPALDRLRLDMLELYPENVKEVESMSQEIRRRIELKQKLAGTDQTHNMKSKLAGLNFMTRTANATSSATSSLFGKIKDLKDSSSKSEETSDQVTNTKTNISNFFSKRR